MIGYWKRITAVLNAHPLWATQVNLGNALFGLMLVGIVVASPHLSHIRTQSEQRLLLAYSVIAIMCGACLVLFVSTLKRDAKRYHLARQLVQSPEAVRDLLANPALTLNGRPYIVYWGNYQKMSRKQQIQVALLLLERDRRQNSTSRKQDEVSPPNYERYDPSERVVYRIPTSSDADC